MTNNKLKKNKIKEELKNLLVSHFKLSGDIPKNLNSDNIENWDSVNHLSLISEIEKIFKIKLNDETAYSLLDDEKILKEIFKIKKLWKKK